MKNEKRIGYKTTKIGLIPNEWKIVNLVKIAKVQRGRFSPRPRNDPKYYGGDIPFVQTGDVANCGGKINSYSQTLNKIGLGVSKLFPEGTILITIAANIGHTGILQIDMAAPDSLIGIICKPESHNKFLNYYLSTQQKRLEYLAPAGAQKNINIDTLNVLKIPLPPLSEQQKIATILSTWDKAIELTEQLIEAKEEQKRGLMQWLLTGKVRVKKFSGDWKEVHLGDIFKERKQAGYNDLPLLAITGDRGVIYRNELDKKDSSNEDKSKYKRICPGDIGYNTMRMWQGRSAVSSLEGIVSPAYTIVTPKKGIDVNFMGSLFQLPQTIHSFWRYSQGLVDDTLNCKFPSFALVKVKIPPTHEEQSAISQILNLAEEEINILTNRLDSLKKQKKGLMQQLLTGKIRVV